MTSLTVPARKQRFRGDRHLFSSSDDTTMLNQLRATHAPDGRDIDVRPLFHIIEDIFHRAAPTIPGSNQVQSPPSSFSKRKENKKVLNN